MVVTVACVGFACAQDLELKNGKELKRTDLGGTTNMEVVLSVTEFQPGEFIKPNGMQRFRFPGSDQW